MDREIIFRQWDKKEKVFQYWGNVEIFPNGVVPDKNCFTFPRKTVLRLPLEQYTGLKDKGGEMIFEGDKIQFTIFENYGVEIDKQYVGYVRFAYGEFQIWNKPDSGEDGAFHLFYIHSQDCEIEVIGNIHEGVGD
jgi:uncharacterized phage protein (TIGR01671 family)